MPTKLKGRNFLKLLDFKREEIAYLLDLAANLKAAKRTRFRTAIQPSDF